MIVLPLLAGAVQLNEMPWVGYASVLAVRLGAPGTPDPALGVADFSPDCAPVPTLLVAASLLCAFGFLLMLR